MAKTFSLYLADVEEKQGENFARFSQFTKTDAVYQKKQYQHKVLNLAL